MIQWVSPYETFRDKIRSKTMASKSALSELCCPSETRNLGNRRVFLFDLLRDELGRYDLETTLMKHSKQTYPRTVHTGGAQKLAPNDVWNIPERGIDEVRLDIITAGMWQTIKTVRGLTIDRDGTVYGIRSLTNAKESGYHLEGQVSIDGRKYSAFTSDVLFQREDGSLCSVGVLYARKDSMPVLPDLDTASDEFLEELSNRYHYSDKKEPRGLLYEYVRAVQILREDDKKEQNRADKLHPELRAEYLKTMADCYESLPLSMKFKGRK